MTSEDIWLITIGILAVIFMVVVTASTRRSVAIGVMIVLIPFQVVETRYASSSVLMAYAMAGTMVLMGDVKVRMLPAIAFVVLAYVLSLVQADGYRSFHLIEMFQFFSCFVVFLLAYNYARLVKDDQSVMDLLLAVNVLVVLYCALQLVAGAGHAFTPFGIEALAFNSNRDPSDPRLVGPFDNPGTTAGYLALMTILCTVELMHATGRRRSIVQVLMLLNMAGIVATGNRASFMVLLASLPVILVAFRRELGARRFVRYLLGGIAAIVIASATIAVYSGFGNMFRRMAAVTETENGMPMTRANTWEVSIEKIKRHPWFGEGPHFFRAEDAYMLRVLDVKFENLGDVESVFDPYPHSLYLFLLRTVGIVGLVAVLWFFIQVAFELRWAMNRGGLGDHARAVVKAGPIVVGAFLVTQVTLEFNRTSTIDYAQFVLALMGLLIGIADRARDSRQAPDGSQAPEVGVASS